MKNIFKKLIAAGIMLAITACMVVTVSYAWMTVSESPSVNGIQVTVGGGRTILLAPDITQTMEDGTVLHYPGAFEDKLVFSQYDSYDYLNELGGLLPVSTADGLTWFLPSYYSSSDQEVKDGMAFSGQIKPAAYFEKDSTLSNANLSEEELSEAGGSYIYLDFWVVSPGSQYQLRVTTGEGDGGSFLIGLPEPEESPDDISGYTLAEAGTAAAASARIGFLVNKDVVQDDSMLVYQRSRDYSDQYTYLLGAYQEKGQLLDTGENRFTIYEPNGTLHTGGSGVEDGCYTITSPLKWNYGAVEATDVSSILTVQKENTWAMSEEGEGTQIERIFQSALAGKTVSNSNEAASVFYRDYLQRQVASYVSKGEFFTSTSNLYAYAAEAGGKTVPAADIDKVESSGATDAVYITEIERNTPQRIRMFIWLEGQDVDCVDEAALSGFALNIELAGSN